MTTLAYPFTMEEAARANEDWGCNCGPAALAFALQRPLHVAGQAIPGFATKRYTSPTMMAEALKALCVGVSSVRRPTRAEMFVDQVALVRVQWIGPWCAAGVNPKAAYRHTHWITTWTDQWSNELVFDVNGGILPFAVWEATIVPHLIPQRGDGRWSPTHVWRLVAEANR